jgi:dTDP-4-dehydrorhamnose reductase
MLSRDRVLIVGVNSKIGGALFKSYAGERLPVFGTSRRKSEIKDEIFYLDVLGSQSDREKLPQASIVFLCAYISNMADCSENDCSEILNVQGTLDLANYFLNKGSFVIFLSSNAVFNNEQNYANETDCPHPRTIYGQQKYEVENQLLSSANKNSTKNLAIVRMTKVLSHDLALLKNWQKTISCGESINAFEDLKICPISLTFAVNSLRKIAESRSAGIFHLSGDAEYSYFEIGQQISEIGGGTSNQVIHTKAAEDNQGKLNSISLGMANTERLLGIQPENYNSLVKNVFNLLKN